MKGNTMQAVWAASVRAFILGVALLLLFGNHYSGKAGVRIAEAAIYGSGALNVFELFEEVSGNYKFSRDQVNIVFQSSTIPQALRRYAAGELDFFISDVGLTPQQLAPFNGIQIPMVGTPLVLAFNLPGFGVNDTILMDRETLARIWLGEIRMWNHEDITKWNPGLYIPPVNITMTYWSPSSSALGYTAIFKTAMSRFSPAFAAALAQANDQLEYMLPSNSSEPWAFPGVAFETGVGRINRTKHTPGMMTYLERQGADAIGLPYIRLINKANKSVEATPQAVQAAMDHFSDLISNGTLVIDVVDCEAEDAWPLSFLSYLTLSRKIEPTTGGCSRASDMLLFLSWTQLNEEVPRVFIRDQFAPLTNPYRRRLINELYTVTCEDVPVLTTPVLLGIGVENALMSDWSQSYSANSFSIKHYASTSAEAKRQMLAGDADYAVTYYWTTARQAPDDSVLRMPSVAFAIGPVYNAPVTGATLILDMSTLAAIIAGDITSWNDSSIRDLNPAVTGFPSGSISVVIGCDNETGLIAPMLQQAFVGTPSGDAAMAKLLNQAACYENPVAQLSATNNTLSVWYTTQVVTQVRNVKLGRLINPKGNVVSANQTCIQSAVQDFASNPQAELLINGNGHMSWPLAGYAFVALNAQAKGDFATAQGLLDWIYWTQTSTQAQGIANNYNLAVPGNVREVQQRTMAQLATITSATGVYVFSLQPCVWNGTICADHGSCSSSSGQRQCACSSGWTGQYCEEPKSEASSSSEVLGPVLGTVLPVGALLLLVIIAAIIVVALLVSRRRPMDDDWEIDYDELEVGDMLGQGGYGEVWKAKWKGSEVAVKVMGAQAITKESRERFINEARIMSRLRHPNIVLFMAASTKPPKLCIVMEYMALGSLFDLLHNSLISELPFMLKIKMIHQAAKGMHFLHSSGIAHRDLKSLNLLLDNKWNVKVSDFGLTSFKESLAKGKRNSTAIEGSVPWMAPEVLEDAVDLNHELADIYAYGIIMWEVLTRNQPYQGLSPAVIAVGVIRNDMRPQMPSDLLEVEQRYVELMVECWGRDPTMRPSFDHIMSQLKTLLDSLSHGSSIMTGTTTSSSSSISSYPNFNRAGQARRMNTSHPDSGSMSSSATGSNDGRMRSSASSSDGKVSSMFVHSVGVPRRDVSFVVCDLARCNESWQQNPAGAAKAITRYSRLIRELATPGEVESDGSVEQRAGGYIFSRSALHSGGTFMIAFSTPADAADFALTLQKKATSRKLAKGVDLHSRVAIHFHEGSARAPADDLARTGYDTAHYGNACKLNLRCAPGRIACSSEFRSALQQVGASSFYFTPKGEDVFSLHAADDQDNDEVKGSFDEEEWDGRWDEGMGLCSSNWCPWVIDRRKITTGAEIGRGNYGQVTRGTYDGRQVAIKKLYKGRLDDNVMIKMRKEAAILSNIDHPNVVKLIGFSIPSSDGNPGKQSGSMLVMELVPRGSLRRLLSDRSVKLTWDRRLRMLRDAALGIAHLHERGVLHRDIKSSNLLVDEDWTVKVGDFGFATAKQDNGTMTRCGTPCWTAPEIMSDSTRKYSEKADVYSFAIVMWEVLTREEPYQHKNMTTVALDVINGERPSVPNDCPKGFSELMQRCWSGKPAARPDMEEIVMFLNTEAGRGHDA